MNLARDSGVAPGLLRAVIAGDCEKLSEEMADVYRFTRAVITTSSGQDELRETIRQRDGDRALIELSYAIAASRIPPTVKRALGYAKSSSVVPVKI